MTGIGIKGIGVVHNATSYIEAGSAAARAALADAGVRAENLGVLINAGAARDMNISEPAVAALIQQGADIHPAFTLDEETAPTSFDLLDGVHGFGTAASIIGDMVSLGDIDYGMVVVGDVHPSMNPFLTATFPLRTDVYAVVLGATDAPELAVSAAQRTTHAPRSEVYAQLNDAGPTARSSIVLDVMDYDDEYFAAVAAAIAALDADHGDNGTQSVLVAPWPEADNERFRAAVGDGVDITVENFGPEGGAAAYFTASPAAALAHAREAGRGATPRRVLTPSVPSSSVTVVSATGR